MIMVNTFVLGYSFFCIGLYILSTILEEYPKLVFLLRIFSSTGLIMVGLSLAFLQPKRHSQLYLN